MSRVLEGHSYPSGSSRKTPARLVVQGSDDDPTLVLSDAAGELLAEAPSSALDVDPRLGSAPRRMTFPDGTLFETADHAGAEALFGRDRWSILHGLEQFHWRLVPITIATIGGAYLVYRYALEYLVMAAVALTPQVLVEQLDRGTMRTLDLTMVNQTQLSTDERAEVQAIFETMLAALPEREADRHSFELHFRDGGRIGPNAFALPGGTIVFTDEFIEMFPDDDIIAAVIGHEIGHVVEQHGLQQFYRALGLYFLITMLAGETGPLMEDVLLEGNALLSLSYSRAHEREADIFGLQLTHEAGYEADAMRRFFIQIMGGDGEPPQFLSSHPSSESRAEAIEQFIEQELQ